MDPELWKFLTKFHTNSDNYNFSGQLSPWLGKFNVERLDLDSFWKIYCDSVIKNPTLVYGIGERPNECLPLLADIDLDTKFNISNNSNLDEKESKFLNDDKTFKKLYSIEDVRVIVLAHQHVIREISKQWKPINCPCLLLEKDHPYYKEGKLKGGFHLHFPKLWIRNCDYDIHILPRVVKYLNDRHPNLFKYLGEDKEPGSYIDPKVCSKHWLLYGSGKSKESSVYRVTTAFDHEGREIAIEDALAGYKLLDARGNQINLTQENIRYYLPRILSTHPANKTILVLKTNLECAIKMAIETAEERTAHHESEDTVGDVQMMRELMEFISPTRADYYDSWFEMACVMYCIGDGCQEAFDMFSDFSSKTTRDNYDETKCLYLWKKLSNSHKYTIGTLKYYANQDSPEKYDAWKKKKQSEYIKLDGQINHYDLACMLKTAYANTFLSTIVNDKVVWFEYADHRWTRSEKGLALRAKISVELVQKFSDEMSKIYKELQDNTDQDRGAELAQLKKAVKSLKTSNFKSAVMTEACEVFNKPKFFKLLDADINLLGFTNGVLDLKNLVFRPGKPEDYISMSTGFDFQEYSESDPDYLEVLNFLEKVFPDPSLRTYFIEYCAYLLRGGNTNKVFLNMTGSGDNAKSIVIMLLELCLGDYCIKFPTSLITGKRTQSAQASPELARSQGVRFAIVQEPDKKEIINDGIIKELTGNDSFFARGLFQDGGEIKPMFKLCLVCNKLLRLSGGDPAMWARIDVLPFESKFPKSASEVPDSVEEQFRKKIFPRDPNFADKLPRLRQPFMWLLFQTYKDLRKKGPTPKPPKVLSATDEYKRANDITLQYITERVTVDNTKTLSINEVYSDFVEWFKLTFTSIKPPNRNELLEELTSRWGIPTETGRWKYKRLKTTRDELKEGSALLYADQKKASNEDLEVDPSTFTQDINNNEINNDLESKENIIQNNIETTNNLVSDTEQLNNNSSSETNNDSSNENPNESCNDTCDSDSEDRIKRVQGLLRQKYKIKVVKNEKNDK